MVSRLCSGKNPQLPLGFLEPIPSRAPVSQHRRKEKKVKQHQLDGKIPAFDRGVGPSLPETAFSIGTLLSPPDGKSAKRWDGLNRVKGTGQTSWHFSAFRKKGIVWQQKLYIQKASLLIPYEIKRTAAWSGASGLMTSGMVLVESFRTENPGDSGWIRPKKK